VSEEEFRDLEAVASKGGLTLSEWCREALLASLNGPEPKSANDSAATGQLALLAELVALRAILLNVLFRQANGQTVTAEEMQGLIDRADSDKGPEGARAFGTGIGFETNVNAVGSASKWGEL